MDNKPHRSLEELKETSWCLSRQIIEMTTKAGSGHPSSSLSAIDLLTALYFGGVMHYDPQRLDWPDRDRFILSKGHGAPGLYVIYAEAGFFDPALLPTLRELGSPLKGHPNMRVLPGVEASTGSLGQGLSIGLGHALAARVDGRKYHVYVMLLLSYPFLIYSVNPLHSAADPVQPGTAWLPRLRSPETSARPGYRLRNGQSSNRQ